MNNNNSDNNNNNDNYNSNNNNVYTLAKNVKCYLMFLHILDVNECSTSHNCDSNASCSNTVGSYMCACDFGYSGDGFNCSGMQNTNKLKERRVYIF